MKIQNSTLRLKSFQEMALAPQLLAALDKMTITVPTDVQSQAIPVGLSESDLIAIAQTGSGKTLAFALPILTALEKKPGSRALVLAPSREMAQQIYKVFEQLYAEAPISASLVIGGIPSAKQISGLKKNPRLIVGTPGRLNDHLQNNKLLLQNVEIVVIDEADRMLDVGFAPQLKNIQSTMRGRRQTMMFSASFGQAVESLAKVFMNNETFMIRSAQAEEPVASLRQKVLFIDKKMKEDRLLDELNAAKGSVIVFTGSQHSCESVGKYLKEYGYSTNLIHGGLSQGQRNRVIRDFREGKTRVLVATDLLARGLDVPHVEHVFNFDLPFQSEDFLHRIGRTARAGRGGNAVTFVSWSDYKMYQKVKPYLQGAEEVKVDPNFSFLDRSKKFDPENKPAHKAVRKPDSAKGSKKEASRKPLGKNAGPYKKKDFGKKKFKK